MTFVILAVLCIIFGINAQKTTVSIKDGDFYINDELTYKSAANSNVHGLLMLSRLIQGVFDDYNTSTVHLWDYPDTKQWDPMRNTQEFVGNMSLWREKGLLSFTVGLQGGSPGGHQQQSMYQQYI